MMQQSKGKFAELQSFQAALPPLRRNSHPEIQPVTPSTCHVSLRSEQQRGSPTTPVKPIGTPRSARASFLQQQQSTRNPFAARLLVGAGVPLKSSRRIIRTLLILLFATCMACSVLLVWRTASFSDDSSGGGGEHGRLQLRRRDSSDGSSLSQQRRVSLFSARRAAAAVGEPGAGGSAQMTNGQHDRAIPRKVLAPRRSREAGGSSINDSGGNGDEGGLAAAGLKFGVLPPKRCSRLPSATTVDVSSCTFLEAPPPDFKPCRAQYSAPHTEEVETATPTAAEATTVVGSGMGSGGPVVLETGTAVVGAAAGAAAGSRSNATSGGGAMAASGAAADRGAAAEVLLAAALTGSGGRGSVDTRSMLDARVRRRTVSLRPDESPGPPPDLSLFPLQSSAWAF